MLIATLLLALIPLTEATQPKYTHTMCTRQLNAGGTLEIRGALTPCTVGQTTCLLIPEANSVMYQGYVKEQCQGLQFQYPRLPAKVCGAQSTVRGVLGSVVVQDWEGKKTIVVDLASGAQIDCQ